MNRLIFGLLLKKYFAAKPNQAGNEWHFIVNGRRYAVYPTFSICNKTYDVKLAYVSIWMYPYTPGEDARSDIEELKRSSFKATRIAEDLDGSDITAQELQAWILTSIVSHEFA